MSEQNTITSGKEILDALLVKNTLRHLLGYVNSVDGSFGCATRYEECVSQQFDPSVKVNYAFMAGHYRMLLDQALSLIPSAYLDKLKEL